MTGPAFGAALQGLCTELKGLPKKPQRVAASACCKACSKLPRSLATISWPLARAALHAICSADFI
jgi:hypothetical protein